MKILTIIGARPQFVKAAVVSRAFQAQEDCEERIVHTGQHFDANMSDVFFNEMGIPAPTHQLDISGGTHALMTARMLVKLEQVMLADKPDVVLVYGDTNSTLAGALAAAKLHIPIVHIEAGLRSFERRMPEEVNRVMTDHLASLLLTPNNVGTENLLNEGISKDQIVQVGDVMFDAALLFGEIAKKSSSILNKYDMTPKTYLLATIHRQENTDDHSRLRAIFEGFMDIARQMPVVLPLHPRTKLSLEAAGLNDCLKTLTVIPPLGYLDMVALEQSAAVIATDSGGVQKEAFFYKVPCVTLREQTEWTELVEAGWNRLVPPRSRAEIAAAVETAKGSQGQDVMPYGHGDASQKSVAAIIKSLTK